MRSLKSRISKFGYKLSEYKCLKKLAMPLFDAYRIEQMILEEFKEERIFLKWSTELFRCNILEEISFKEVRSLLPQ